MNRIRTPIIQFGTSRFLQAHADLFFSEGHPIRDVTIVQSSGDVSRARRLSGLAQPEGFPVRIRGLLDGRIIDEERRVKCVKRTLTTASDWEELSAIITEDAEVILSNTGDRGFEAMPADQERGPSQAQSYPAKLLHLLTARQRSGGSPLTIFPMELVPKNGNVLRARVFEIAEQLGANAELVNWLRQCIWANSLVDRIVSEPIDPVGAVAEPYALWAIESQVGLQSPTVHPAIRLVDKLEPIERLKLHILNLGHTVMAEFWCEDGAQPDATVRSLLAGRVGDKLRTVMETEVIPGFAWRKMEDAARTYLSTTLERFANPFLNHRIADIAQNHSQKVERRILGFLTWVREVRPNHRSPVLDSIVTRQT